MIKVGDYNVLRVIKEKGKGYLLKEEGIKDGEDVFLPEINTRDKELELGDKVSAFVYRDNQGKLISTLEKPLARAGELAYLKVVGLPTFGAFVDMGLDRDILVPLKEKIYPFKKDKSYLFYVYVDKTGRLAASAYVEKHLDSDHNFKVGDEVKGTVYGFQSNNSLKIAVENKYKGVVLYNEYFNRVEYGDTLWSIAQEYVDYHYDSILEYVNEVRSINHITGDIIREGQTLIVPYYSTVYK